WTGRPDLRDGWAGRGSWAVPRMTCRRLAGGQSAQRGDSSGETAVAVLVLLAAAAGAGIVAADLGAFAHDRRLRALLVVRLGRFLVGAVAACAGVLELRLAQPRLDLRALL